MLMLEGPIACAATSGAAHRRAVGSGDEAELAHIQLAQLGLVLAHVAGPVRDHTATLVAVPRVALRPGRAGEACLHGTVARRLYLRAHVDRAAAARAHLRERLAHVGRLRLQIEDDRA